MKLLARVTRPLDPPHTSGRCDVELLAQGEASLVARGLEFGEVQLQEAGERSLSEFEVTLFEGLEPGQGARLRVRRWHRYEGATATLRDVWLEARFAPGAPPALCSSGPAPAPALRVLARVWWKADAGTSEPRQE